MKKVFFVIFMVLVTSFVSAQEQKTVVVRTVGNVLIPLGIQYYDSDTGQWFSAGDWERAYGVNDLQNHNVVFWGKDGVDGMRRKVVVDKNFAMAGTTLICASALGYITGKLVLSKKRWDSEGIRNMNKSMTIAMSATAGVGVLTILLGLKYEYEGVPLGKNSYVDTAGTGIKYTKKF